MRHLSYGGFMAEAARLLEEWRERMGLCEWDIRLVSIRENEAASHRGHCWWDIQTLKAEIGILHPSMWDEENLGICDVEDIIIHELSHLCFWSIEVEDGSLRAEFFEQAINRVVRSFKDLKYNSQQRRRTNQPNQDLK
jgi:hypothetical protein